MALRILRGENIADLPVESGPPNRVFVDWRQLQKWGIPANGLPAGTVVMYREPTVWDTHKPAIVATAAVVLLQSAFIILLVAQVRRRKRSERAVRQLTRRVINANENESRRIARELHDDIGQRLSLAVVQLDLFRSQVAADALKNRSDPDDPFETCIRWSRMFTIYLIVCTLPNSSTSAWRPRSETFAGRCRTLMVLRSIFREMQPRAASPRMFRFASIGWLRKR